MMITLAAQRDWVKEKGRPIPQLGSLCLLPTQALRSPFGLRYIGYSIQAVCKPAALTGLGVCRPLHIICMQE